MAATIRALPCPHHQQMPRSRPIAEKFSFLRRNRLDVHLSHEHTSGRLRMPLRRLLLLLLLIAGSAAHAASPGTHAIAKALDARLNTAQNAGFSGAVLVADGNNIVYTRNIGQGIDDSTRFNLASSGKMFTAVAIMQLVQQGKLDLDAPIGRYLPKWPVATVREKVTARQLLLHTSGLGIYWGEAFDKRRAQLHELADYQPLLVTEPKFAPGTQWAYSNTGFMMLGLLVEAVSGEDFYAYIQRHVFDPAGMQDSGYFDVDGIADRVATPHRDGVAQKMPEPRGGAAGGGYSTTRDMLRFHRALTGGKLLDAKTTALLFAPVTLPEGTRAPPHGLGMLRFVAGEDVVYGHPGGAPGVGSDFRATQQSGWALVMFGNNDDVRTMRLADELAGLLADAGAPDLRFAMP
jgi:CubicO group peptidase (beta-lactamase class C family)